MNLIATLFKKSQVSAVPFISQRQAGGDGLACVASILMFHNFSLAFSEVEAKYHAFNQGINLRQIIDIFSAHGIQSRALQCSVKELNSLNMPCILHWDMKQFVILSQFHNGKYEILNPADKRQWLTEDELEHHYNEIALEIIPH